MRKTLLTILASVLAVTVAVIGLPGSAASAKPSTGDFGGCYGINKAGNYNSVYTGATVTASGKDVIVHGFVKVAKRCQKSGSVPLRRITIRHARLRDARTGKVVRLSGGHSSTTKAVVRSTTSGKYAACKHGFYASVEVSYTYSDGSYVHPFWIHGPKFTRC